MTDFYQTFIQMMEKWSAISADLENVDQGHHLEKTLYLGNYMTEFNQSFTKMTQLGMAAKASHQLIFKMLTKVIFHRVISSLTQSNISYYQTDLNQCFKEEFLKE